MNLDYWQKQTSSEPLFPDMEWNKPERRDQAGRLGIIGGNKLGFAGVAEAYNTAVSVGAGEVRLLLPDALKKTIPKSITEVIYAPTTLSGGLAKDAYADMISLSNWSQAILLGGDAGRNSETAVAYETFLATYQGQVVITRDAVDLVLNSSEAVAMRADTSLVVSFAQLQKLFRTIYYPKVLTFNMQLLQLVEAIHKFTLTYPVQLCVLHKDTLVIAHGGQVATMPWQNPMVIWRGILAAKISTYTMWAPDKPFQSTCAAVLPS